MTVVQPLKILISACILLTVFFIYDEENLYYREDLIHLFVPYFFFSRNLFVWLSSVSMPLVVLQP